MSLSFPLKKYFPGMPIIFAVMCLFSYAPMIAQDETTTEEKTEAPANLENSTPENSAPENKEDTSKKTVVPEFMTEYKELMSENELAELDRELDVAQYKVVLRKGQNNREALDIIDKWAKWRMYSLSMKKYKFEYKEICDDTRKEILSAGAGLPPNGRPRYREMCADKVLEYAKDLLDVNFYARLNVAIMFSLMDIEGKSSASAAVPYAQGGELLADMIDPRQENDLNQPEQPVAVKLCAAKGLERIGYYADPKPVLKFRFAEAIIKELKKPNNFETHKTYQCQLLEALAAQDQINDLNGEATILQTLTATMLDENRPWMVRGAAAKSLGRASKDSKVNFKLLSYEIVRTCHEMAKAYNQNPGSRDWNWAFFNCYLAYQSGSSEERIPRRLGLINQTGTDEYVRASYFQILKLVNHFDVFSGNSKEFPDTLLEEVATWLEENKPLDRSIVPGMAPIVHSSPDETPDQKTAKSTVPTEEVTTE